MEGFVRSRLVAQISEKLDPRQYKGGALHHGHLDLYPTGDT